MKKQISLLFAVFLCCSTISWAQNPEESKMKDEFYKTLNSLRQEKKQALDKIQKEVDHMSSLISDILMISRLENKDVEVVLHPVHLKPIVDDILESLQVEIDKKGLTVNTDLTEVTYLANHQHMQQLMNNLINNAVKYNQDQGSIKIDSYVSEHDYVIEVSDTGRGISLIDQGRVFERFFRCDPGRDKETGGTGLGLAIVKHYCSILSKEQFNYKVSLAKGQLLKLSYQ